MATLNLKNMQKLTNFENCKLLQSKQILKYTQKLKSLNKHKTEREFETRKRQVHKLMLQSLSLHKIIFYVLRYADEC